MSEPGEMSVSEDVPLMTAGTSKKIGKFDMHVHTSKMSQHTLDELVAEFGIPADLNPMLPPPDMTMNELKNDKIGVYVQQIRLGGVRIPFSTFFLAVIKYFKVHFSQIVPIGVNRVTLFEVRCYSLGVTPSVLLFRVFYRLCKQGNWFSFESRTGRRAMKCFEEVLTGLKFWKDFFFLIDRRAIPDAMPWRHKDSRITDKFPENYSVRDARRIAGKPILLRTPPNCLLYEYGLTDLFDIVGHRIVIKNIEGNGNDPLHRFVIIHFICSFLTCFLTVQS